GHATGPFMLHRGAFAQGSPSPFGLDLGAELLLERLVLADGQAPAVPAPGGGTLRPQRTGIAGPGRKLGILARDHWHRLAIGTGDRAVQKVQREVVLGKQRPAWRPGGGQSVTP